MATLLCTVRGCRAPLTREERRLTCARGHSFDVARSGYVNLLQPGDRRSARPGDSREAVAARRRSLERGLEAPLVEALIEVAPDVAREEAVLDVGSGEGHHLAAIANRFGCEGYGVDISVPAIEAAARRYGRLCWIVANADRFIPFADRSFRLISSVTARMNPGEFRRVLRDDGALLVAVPGPDDLVELRAAVLGEGVRRDRVERTVATFAPLFTLVRHRRVSHVVHLDAAAARDVMTGAYRALRSRERARLAAIGEIDATLSRDVLLFRVA